MHGLTSVSCLQSFWQSIAEISSNANEECIASSSNLLSTTWGFSSTIMSSTANNVNWMIMNRGGLAQVAGLVMVPSQFMGPNYEESVQIIDTLCNNSTNYNATIVEKFFIICGETTIAGIICYPPGWQFKDNNRCMLYHNPNGIITAGYFQGSKLSWTPGIIFEKEQVPIILYDYRGTGLSKNNQDSLSSVAFQFHPTYASIAEDGVTVLKYALSQFKQVDVWGSSLGGGVATIALDHHLQQNPDDKHRVILYNHDSFSTTSRVVLPTIPSIANLIGSAVGGNLDAATSMQNLIARNIKITVLCHHQDPVIPTGARMAEFVESLSNHNVFVIYSPKYGHADLSHDMIQQIWKS